MLNLGQLNTLKAVRRTENGIYLEDEDANEVLLPNKYIPADLELEGSIEVFLYKDSEDRIIATNLTPKIMLNQYVTLKAKSITKIGAFFDWGLEKDLLVPYREQIEEIEEDEHHVIYLYLDKKSERLVGTTKIENTLDRDIVDLKIGDEVKILAYQDSDLGISVIVNDKYQGILYNNEVFQEIFIGDELKAYIRKIRSDGKIDLRLNKFGYRGVDENIKKIYKVLEENNGTLKLNDKSSPEDISNQLGMSKKVFKKAIGALYKQKLLSISDDGIKLLENKED